MRTNIPHVYNEIYCINDSFFSLTIRHIPVTCLLTPLDLLLVKCWFWYCSCSRSDGGYVVAQQSLCPLGRRHGGEVGAVSPSRTWISSDHSLGYRKLMIKGNSLLATNQLEDKETAPSLPSKLEFRPGMHRSLGPALSSDLRHLTKLCCRPEGCCSRGIWKIYCWKKWVSQVITLIIDLSMP